MGQIADDMINGYCCSLCGVYFEDEHGYPVVCKGCWDNLSEEDKKNFQLAYFEEL